MRLLVVEDEETLARHLIRGLREEGHEVDHAASLAAAAGLAAEGEYDLALLDLKLPDGSGLDLLRRWREENLHFPVLVLTARDTVGDRVEGLDSGAHDYLTKPFSFDELLARVRSLLRRRVEPPARRQVFAELAVARDAMTAEVGGRPLRLTARELALLECFLQHPRRVLSRRAIAEQVWDASGDADSNVIDVLVGRLRRKITAAGGRSLLHAVKGLGYVLREPEED